MDAVYSIYIFERTGEWSGPKTVRLTTETRRETFPVLLAAPWLSGYGRFPLTQEFAIARD